MGIEDLKAGLSLGGDQFIVLLGGEIHQDAAASDSDSLVETRSAVAIHKCSASSGKRNVRFLSGLPRQARQS